MDDRRGSLPMDDLLACRQLGVQITDLTTFVERDDYVFNANDSFWLADTFDSLAPDAPITLILAHGAGAQFGCVGHAPR